MAVEGDKLANKQRYLLRGHKPVLQGLLKLKASKLVLGGSCGGGRETSARTSDSTS